MITILWISLVLLVVISTWLATIERAMQLLTPLTIQHEVEVRGFPQRASWLSAQYENIIQSISLTKTIAFLFMVCTIVLMFSSETIQWSTFGIGLGIAGAVQWIFTSVIAGAIAKSVPASTVINGWWIIKFVSIVGLCIGGLVELIGEITRRLSGANLRNVHGDKEVEEQLLLSIEQSQREGGIPAEAAEMLENVVDLGSTDVGEIMTPRIDIEGIELTNELSEIRSFVLESGYSRIPVFEENLDQILGILYVKDLVAYLGAEANGFTLTSILRKPIVVPETKLIQELLADFQTSEVHMAVVIDEYGGTAGLVTIEDVLEEIVGEIRDEHDDSVSDEPVLERIDENLVEVDGRYNLDDLNDELGIHLPEDEEYDTIAGFLLAKLGHVPLVGEVLEANELRFKTLKATSTQIERLSIEFSITDSVSHQ